MARSRPFGDPTTLRDRAAQAVTVVDAGVVDYATAWAWQRDLARRRADDQIGDVLLLVQHPPTYTLGRRADRDNVLLDEQALDAAGIAVFDVDRGGDVTWHGPGQLVGYPVLRLAGPRVVDYVRALEELNIGMLATHGIEAGRIEGLTGVWTDDGKVTAIGVRVTAGRITQHGWATNVAPDLSDFQGIVPCGITDRAVTSMRELGCDASMADVIHDTAATFADILGTDTTWATAASLDLHAGQVVAAASTSGEPSQQA